MKSCRYALVLGVASASTFAFAQANTGQVLTAGNDVFAFGTAVSNGVPGAALPLHTSSVASTLTSNCLNVSEPAGSPRRRHVSGGNWFYRLGNDTRERQLANATTKVLSGTNAVEYNYIGNLVTAGSAVVQDVDAQTCYQLTDTGPNTVRLYTYLCFNNRSAATITANGFCVFDFDVDGTIGNDVVQPLFSTSALKSWTMTDGLSTGRLTGPGCFGAAAGTASQIAAAMTNGSVDTFFPDVNAGGIATPGNYLLGLEFQTILFPGQSVCFPVYIDFGVNGEVPPIVPEPSTLAMAGVAIGAFVLRRRRR